MINNTAENTTRKIDTEESIKWNEKLNRLQEAITGPEKIIAQKGIVAQLSPVLSYKRGEGEERGEGDWESKGRGQAADELRLGFLNCRGWHSREVDVKMMLRKLDLDVMGLAETFLNGIKVGGYTWHGQNRQYCKRASGGVGLLVKKHLKVLPLRSQTGSGNLDPSTKHFSTTVYDY